MISARHLTKHFNGKPAVKDVSFGVDKGQTLALLGTSGCGKTTTLKMLNRLIAPDSGEVWIDDKLATTEDPQTWRRNIGYVLQDTGLFPHYTVAENIATVPRLLGWDAARIKKRINELLEKLHLPQSTATAYPAQLSGGQQQRVGIARALAVSPPVLLMDEPFGALDPITRASITEDFKHLDERQSQTIVLVTHDVSEAFALADCICLMNNGSIVQTGTAEDLLFRPVNEFVRTFFNKDRLQLELSAIRIAALSPFLNGMMPTLIETQTIWDSLQTLNLQDDSTGKAAKIMMAFTLYKNARH